MAWGGARPGAGRKKVSGKPAGKAIAAKPERPALRAEPKVARASVAAEPKAISAIDPRAWVTMLPEIEELSRRYATKAVRTAERNPFVLPKFPAKAEPKDEKLTMAFDTNLVGNLTDCANGWLAGDVLAGLAGEGLQFMGYAWLSELAQQPEYRIMSETIADDATRKWIDFDVTGDEKKQREDRAKDPAGHDERMADPDERKKRVEAAGKTDRVKELQDDQLRLQVQQRYYEQARNGGFFGRTHLFHDIRTVDSNDIKPDELKTSIGDSRDAESKGKVPKGSFKGLRTIEPVWTYPLMYNAINPIREDWYNPQVWFVMGQEIHGSRLQTFVPHPVPDMLKPAYAFGGLSLTQMAKPYVDRWLTTVTSVNQLIHSFSVMVLMTDLSTLMQPGNVANLIARAAMFNMFRDNQGIFLTNKNTEDFKNVSATLSGLHELQAQSQEHVASINRIPLVKYTGIQPAGLNASSEGEIEVYDDTIGAYQMRVLDANLRRTINFEQLSLWGDVDPEITHSWQQLRPMTQEEKGKKEKDDAERNQKYVDMGAIGPAEVRRIIVNDKELPYTGLDPDDVPEPPSDPDDGGGDGDGDRDSATGGGDRPDKGAGAPDPSKGGGANDADLPFGADSDWREADHPRAENGQFGAGAAISTKAHGSRQGEALASYLQDFSLNEMLRTGKLGAESTYTPQEARQVIADIDALIASKKTDAPATVYRGFGKMGPGDFKNSRGIVRDKAFLSTSPDEAVARQFSQGGYIARIELPAGSNAIMVDYGDDPASRSNEDQREVILPRGLPLEIVGVNHTTKTVTLKPKPRIAIDNYWATDPLTGEPVVLAGDEWNEADHPRGQPDNAGQFGASGGGAETKRRYGGLYRQTGNGAKADHEATVEYALSGPPRAGSSYRELLTRLVKDAPELGGDVEKLKAQLGQSYILAREQLLAKSLGAATDAESKKFAAMADRAKAKAEALGWKPKDAAPPPMPAGWAAAGDVSPELARFREKTRDYCVAYGKEHGREVLTGFDVKTGKPIEWELMKSQGAKNVQFSNRMIQEIMDPSNEMEFHHNHPSDVSFSAADLDSIAFAPGMNRIYAHGHLGSVYAVDGAEKVRTGLRPVMDAGADAIYSEIGRLPGVEPTFKSRIHQHVLMLGLERAKLIRGYRATLAPDLEAWFGGKKGLVDLWTGRVAERATEKRKTIV